MDIGIPVLVNGNGSLAHMIMNNNVAVLTTALNTVQSMFMLDATVASRTKTSICLIRASVNNQIRIGQVLYGNCGGIFGRDSYNPKRIEAIGPDWIVVRDDQGYLHFASFASGEEITEAFAMLIKCVDAL